MSPTRTQYMSHDAYDQHWLEKIDKRYIVSTMYSLLFYITVQCRYYYKFIIVWLGETVFVSQYYHLQPFPLKQHKFISIQNPI